MLLGSILVLSAFVASASASDYLPDWASMSPPGTSVSVNGATSINERLYLVGEQSMQDIATAGSCWVAMLESSFDDIIEEGMQTYSTFESSPTSHCSLIAAAEFQGDLILLGTETVMDETRSFLQLGLDKNNLLFLDTPGEPVGLVADSRRNTVVVASTTARDLYLNAFRMVGDRASDLEQVWENHVGDLTRNLDESFNFAGMVVSEFTVTLAGSTSGTPNISSNSSPMNKSMQSYYQKFADSFIVQVDIITGDFTSLNAPMIRLSELNDLNEHAYGICQDPRHDGNVGIAYIVGQTVSEFEEGPKGVPTVTKVELDPFQVVWSKEFPELNMMGQSFTALEHCVVFPEMQQVFVAGTATPDVPSRHDPNPSIPVSPAVPVDTNPRTCPGNKIYDEFFEECACPDDMEEDSETAMCYPRFSPCLDSPCPQGVTCVHVPAQDISDPFAEASFSCGGSPTIPTGGSSSSPTPSCPANKIFEPIEGSCVCPSGLVESQDSDFCHPPESPCLNNPCPPGATCTNVPAVGPGGVNSFQCTDPPSVPSGISPLTPSCPIGMIYDEFFEECVCPDGLEESLGSIGCHPPLSPCLNDPCPAGLTCSHIPGEPGSGDSFECVTSAGTSSGSGLSGEPSCAGDLIYDSFFEECVCPEGSSGSLREPGRCHPFDSPCFDGPCPAGETCVDHVDEFGSASFECVPSTRRKLLDPSTHIVVAKISALTGEIVWNEMLDSPVAREELHALLMDPDTYHPIVIGNTVEIDGTSEAFVLTLNEVDGSVSQISDVDPAIPPSGDESPLWMHQDMQEQFDAPEVDTEVDTEGKDFDGWHIVYISAGAVAGLIACCCISIFCIRASKRQRMEDNQRRVMDIFSYLHPFNVDDIDIRKSPAGGFLGTYKGNLARGENGAAGDSSLSSAEGGEAYPSSANKLI